MEGKVLTYIKKPDWLKKDLKRAAVSGPVNAVLAGYSLNTVCNEAGCPNKGECFSRGTATFLIMGKNCTRNCRFCKITKAAPEELNPREPLNIAKAIQEMNLKHTVITSVTRDDLPDGGAGHFANTIFEIRKLCPDVTIEVLIPDFKGDYEALKKVVDANPDIINHNVETVPGLYNAVRPTAVFERSLELLRRVKEINGNLFTKSGFMVGLGEKEEEVIALLYALRGVGCDIVTIGQYLQPSREHYEVVAYIHPDQFQKYEEFAQKIGFQYVASGPLVRSSYHAEDGFSYLKKVKI
ncbi:radical sam [Lucifera butyrica]|uniref:Lipoyl synthase n=1 Tax=Lucifera butyrica TaxID=1351585 RepID=A0A498R4S2_9FIRM|nr:lipoyl synthase [Lucifera butyrica]VBB06444.1 radical sam [Lucifera butyrica]